MPFSFRAHLFGLCLLLLARSASAGVTIVVADDVLTDYQRMVERRDVIDIKDFRHPASRRDVVELILIQQALRAGGDWQPIQFIGAETHARLFRELAEGRAQLSGGSSWEANLPAPREAFLLTDPVIEDGEFRVGLFTAPDNPAANVLHNRASLSQLSAVTMRDWVIDWQTLQSLNLRRLEHTEKATSMVRMVAAGRVDFLLAPFPANDSLNLNLFGKRLIPLPGIRLMLPGARHFVVSANAPNAAARLEQINRGLRLLKASGVISKAYQESGFQHPRTAQWTVLNPR